MARSYDLSGDLSGGSSGAAYSGGGSYGDMTEDQFYRALGYPKKRLPDGTLQQMSPERMSEDEMNSLFSESGGPKKVIPAQVAATRAAQQAAPPEMVPSQTTATPKVIQTPFGTIATTNPQGQAMLEQVPNALARERVFDSLPAAQNYRDLPANAAPGEREAARQEYADALNQRGGRWPVPVSTAFGAPQRPPEDPAKIAKYNAFLVDQGINPYTIGTAEMTEGGGLRVTPIQEEAKANFVANQAAERMRGLEAVERHARKAARAKGADKAAKEAAMEAKLERLSMG